MPMLMLLHVMHVKQFITATADLTPHYPTGGSTMQWCPHYPFMLARICPSHCKLSNHSHYVAGVCISCGQTDFWVHIIVILRCYPFWQLFAAWKIIFEQGHGNIWGLPHLYCGQITMFVVCDSDRKTPCAWWYDVVLDAIWWHLVFRFSRDKTDRIWKILSSRLMKEYIIFY